MSITLTGNELSLKRGSNATMQWDTFVNPDGSPRVYSSRLTHPYLVFSLVDDVYSTKRRKALYYWFDLSKSVRFYDTDISDWTYALDLSANVGLSQTTAAWLALDPTIPASMFTTATKTPFISPIEECVWAYKGQWYYWRKVVSNFVLSPYYGVNVQWDMSLLDSDELKDGNYFYDVTCVSGQTTYEKLVEIAKYLQVTLPTLYDAYDLWVAIKSWLDNPPIFPVTLQTASPASVYVITYQRYKEIKELFEKRIDLECPLFEEDYCEEVKSTNKFIVEQYLKGGSAWRKI